MSGLTNEQWKRIFNGVADRAPEIFKDCDLQFSISVRNEDGTEETIDVLNMALEDETVSRMKVFTLIKAAPGYGFARTQQTMKRLRIAESRRIKGLGANQRAALVELFGGGSR